MTTGSVSRTRRFGQTVYMARLADGLIVGYFDTVTEAQVALRRVEGRG